MAVAVSVSMMREGSHKEYFLSLSEMSWYLGDVAFLKKVPYDSLQNCTANGFYINGIYEK